MNDQEIQQYVDKHVCVVDVKYEEPTLSLVFPDGLTFPLKVTSRLPSLLAGIRSWLSRIVEKSQELGHTKMSFCQEVGEELRLEAFGQVVCQIERPFIRASTQRVSSATMSRWAESHCMAIAIARMAEANKPKEAPASEDGLSEHEKLYHEKQGVAYAISAITKKPYEHPGDKVGLGDMVDEVEELVRAERIGAIVDAASVIIPGAKGSLMPKGMDEGETILYFGSKVGELLFGQWKADREKLVDFAAETFPRAEAGDFPIPKDFSEALEAIRKMIRREIDHAKAEATVAERNRIKGIIDQERSISLLFSGEKRVKKLKRKLEDAERNMLAQRFLRDDLERIAKSLDPKKED